jgi:hypothetical protein
LAKFKLNTTFPNLPVYPLCSQVLTAAQPNFSVMLLPTQPSTAFDTVNFLVISADPGLAGTDGATAMVQLKNGTSLGPFTLKRPGDPGWDTFSAVGESSGQDPTLSFSLGTKVSAADVSQIVVTFLPPTSGGSNDTWAIEEISVSLSSSDGTKTRLARSAFGQVNSFALMDQTSIAIQEMMRLGMLIDIDHMSDGSNQWLSTWRRQ